MVVPGIVELLSHERFHCDRIFPVIIGFPTSQLPRLAEADAQSVTSGENHHCKKIKSLSAERNVY